MSTLLQDITYWTGFSFLSTTLMYVFSRPLLSRFLDSVWHNGTVLVELESLGQPRPTSPTSEKPAKIAGTAVIAGCSLAGLMTARVCSDHFENVLVVDPDATIYNHSAKSESAKKRPRVPQYYATHLYQTISILAYRKCFPDWDVRYIAAGAIISNRPPLMYYGGIPSYPYPCQEKVPAIHFASRDILETVLRQAVVDTCPNVSFVHGSVVGINPDVKNPGRVSGVMIQEGIDSNKDKIATKDAALVVDCAGPIKAGLTWLSKAGYGKIMQPASVSTKTSLLSSLEVAYNARITNSISEFNITPEMADRLERIVPGGYRNREVLMSFLMFPQHGNKFAGMQKVSQTQLSVFCVIWGETVYPEGLEEYTEFFRSIVGVDGRKVPEWVFEVLNILFEKEPDKMLKLKHPPCTRIQYEQATNLPSNFIAIGDASSRFNPVFGQGTSQSIMGACLLDHALRNLPHEFEALSAPLPADFSSKFFKAQAKKVADPLWSATKNMDYRYATTVTVPGEDHSVGRAQRWFAHHLTLAAAWHKDVRRVRNEVRMFLAPPASLFAPKVIAVVVYQWLTGKLPPEDS